MDLKGYKGAIEAMLFASGEPVSAGKLAECLEIEVDLVEKLIRSIMDDLEEADRGIMLLHLNNAYQFTTKIQFAEYVKSLLDTRRNTPLSSAALEVLAVIAYNQPVSRAFVEQVRGVDSNTVLQTLLQKGLIDEAGRLDLPGRPISYRTTEVFLRTFGFSSLKDLPPVHTDDEESVAMEEKNDSETANEVANEITNDFSYSAANDTDTETGDYVLGEG